MPSTIFFQLGDLQTFNNSKKSAVLEPRTGAIFEDLTFEAKDFKMCPRGLHLWKEVKIRAINDACQTAEENLQYWIIISSNDLYRF